VAHLRARFPFLSAPWALRLVRAYGTQAADLLGDARSAEELGLRFGWDLTEAEVRWLMRHEWARTAEDVLWRRGKLGLRLTAEEAAHLASWMDAQAAGTARQAPHAAA
jgi:glycerol-3-phosphate dehydrogenase